MLQWEKIRDNNTCEVYYVLHDWLESNSIVATIHKVGYRFKCQILNHQPYHCLKLKVAQGATQKIYEEVTKQLP